MKTTLTDEQILLCAAVQKEFWAANETRRRLAFLDCCNVVDIETPDTADWPLMQELFGKMVMHRQRVKQLLAQLQSHGITQLEALLACIPGEPSEIEIARKRVTESLTALEKLHRAQAIPRGRQPRSVA